MTTGRTVGDYSPISWASGTGTSRNHTPPNESIGHHEASLVQFPAIPHCPRVVGNTASEWSGGIEKTVRLSFVVLAR